MICSANLLRVWLSMRNADGHRAKSILIGVEMLSSKHCLFFFRLQFWTFASIYLQKYFHAPCSTFKFKHTSSTGCLHFAVLVFFLFSLFTAKQAQAKWNSYLKFNEAWKANVWRWHGANGFSDRWCVCLCVSSPPRQTLQFSIFLFSILFTMVRTLILNSADSTHRRPKNTFSRFFVLANKCEVNENIYTGWPLQHWLMVLLYIAHRHTLYRYRAHMHCVWAWKNTQWKFWNENSFRRVSKYVCQRSGRAQNVKWASFGYVLCMQSGPGLYVIASYVRDAKHRRRINYNERKGNFCGRCAANDL